MKPSTKFILFFIGLMVCGLFMPFVINSQVSGYIKVITVTLWWTLCIYGLSYFNAKMAVQMFARNWKDK